MINKPQVIGIGINGLVGSRIVQVLENEFDFIPFGITNGIDITKKETLKSLNDYPNADFVLHLAAKADVDGCEKDKAQGKSGEAWKINVNGTKNVAEVARDAGKKLIYISTDFVFDGEKKEGESYTEEDEPNPINWYSMTKYEGEREVLDSDVDCLILRLAYPFRADFQEKKDFVRFLKQRLEEKQETKVVTDHIFCPTFIDDFAHAIGKLIEIDSSGIYHVVGSDSLSPYDAALKIADVFELDKSLISKTTRKEFFKDRAPRPFNLTLSNAKIEELGVKMRGFEESLQVVKSQLQ